MKYIRKARCSLLLLMLLAAGCSRNQAPQPLAVDQVPAAMNTAFAKASNERKELVERALSALQGKEYSKAVMVVEGLCAAPDLTAEQRETATRALLTLNQELMAAIQRGDKSAEEFQRLRQSAR